MKKRAFMMMFIAGSIICAGLVLGFAQTSSNGVAGQQKESKTSISVSRNDDNWNWMWSENGKRLEMKIKGKVAFTDDYSDIKSLSPNGFITIKDERTAVSRK